MTGYAALDEHLRGRFSRRNATGETDVPVRKQLSRRLRTAFLELVEAVDPDLVVEVGAHEARFSLMARKLCPRAAYVAFEGNPEVFDVYREKLSAEGIDYRHACVTDREGEVAFRIPVKHGKQVVTMGSMLADTVTPDFVEHQIRAVTLDQAVGGGAERIALWIDVEGAAGAVLTGGPSALEHCVAAHVEVETRQRWEGQAVDAEVFAAFAAHGLVPVMRDAQRDWQYNVVLARPDAEGLAIVRDFSAYASAL